MLSVASLHITIVELAQLPVPAYNHNLIAHRIYVWLCHTRFKYEQYLYSTIACSRYSAVGMQNIHNGRLV